MVRSVVYSDGPEIEWYLRASETKYIGGAGYGFFMLGDGFTYINNLSDGEGLLHTGGLYLIENQLETASSSTELRQLRAAKMLEKI